MDDSWKVVREWLDQKLSEQQVPRVEDIIQRAKDIAPLLSPKQVRQNLKRYEPYAMNLQQQKLRKYARSYRPIIVNQGGSFHADLAFFSKTEDATPI